MITKAYILVECAPGRALEVTSAIGEKPWVTVADVVTGPADVIATVEAVVSESVDMTVLMDIAKVMQLPISEIQRVLDDGSALAALCRDIELRDEFRVEGSPTYILNEGRQKLYGNVGYRIIQANLHEILKQPKVEASWC